MGSKKGWGAHRDREQAGMGLWQPHVPTNSGSVHARGSCCPAEVRTFHRGEQVRKHELERNVFSSWTVNASKQSS